jgi:protein-disulfide isomerase
MPKIRFIRVVPLSLASMVACASTPPAPPRTTVALPTAMVAPAPPPAPPMPSEDDAMVPISPRNPTWGSRTARVTIVEFSDFQCPYCARVQTPLAALREMYGPDELRIVWKNNPLAFHQNARPAAIAAAGVFELAGVDAFWKFHDKLFANQKSLLAENFETWAAEAGVTDMAAFRAGIASGRWADPVDADLRDAKSAGANGSTPTFYINGMRVNGAQPFEKFQTVIDDESKKAQEKLDAGTPRERLYAEMARQNYVTPTPEKAEPPQDTTTVYKIPVGTSPVLGSPNALVTIVEFGDFQCPFCARAEPTLAELRQKYGDRIRFVWKNEALPFHLAAEPAAQAALEVRAEKGDKAFWQVHDALFAAQKTFMKGDKDVDLDAIVQIAVAAGADAARVRKAIADHTHKKTLDDDEFVGEDFAASGTPHFFIDGRRVVGAQPPETFEKIIDDEIPKAQELVKKGTRPGALYEALIHDGKEPPEPDTADLPRGLPPNDPARGSAGAKVVIHEFADFQCPFSQRVEATLARIAADYGPKVRFVWHDLPLPMHPDAALAAQAAREAYAQKGPSGFWALHDKMFANQKSLTRADLDGYAAELKLDAGPWAAALDSGAHATEVETDRNVAHSNRITGTPAFFVVPAGASVGYSLTGAQRYGAFRSRIERALSGPPPRLPTLPAPPAAKADSGPVMTTILTPGSGPAAQMNDKLRVHYTGWLYDGTKFDSSRDRNAPFEFFLGTGQVIKGWDQGLVGMKVGEKRKLVVPPSLAYGEAGRTGFIPPNATLVFEVELLAIEAR